MKKVIVVCGPTSSGKTTLSLALAKIYQLEIINGDSVQVYKKYNIGSAKIREDDMQGIQHHLLDIKEPHEMYDVAQFQKDARHIINQQSLSMMVGGTGLYIKSALYDYRFDKEEKNTYASIVFPDPNVMVNTIRTYDSQVVIDSNNIQRLKRMYEKVLQGKKPSENQYKNVPLYQVLTLYLDIPKELLKENLISRLNQQIKDGFIEEVKHLKTLGHIKDVIGYREINSYLNDEISLDEAKEMIIKKSLAFAKRQKTWFLNQMKPHIIDATSVNLIDDCKKEIDAWLR
jgi:tRNA dimethylallyltransferase